MEIEKQDKTKQLNIKASQIVNTGISGKKNTVPQGQKMFQNTFSNNKAIDGVDFNGNQIKGTFNGNDFANLQGADRVKARATANFNTMMQTLNQRRSTKMDMQREALDLSKQRYDANRERENTRYDFEHGITNFSDSTRNFMTKFENNAAKWNGTVKDNFGTSGYNENTMNESSLLSKFGSEYTRAIDMKNADKPALAKYQQIFTDDKKTSKEKLEALLSSGLLDDNNREQFTNMQKDFESIYKKREAYNKNKTLHSLIEKGKTPDGFATPEEAKKVYKTDQEIELTRGKEFREAMNKQVKDMKNNNVSKYQINLFVKEMKSKYSKATSMIKKDRDSVVGNLQSKVNKKTAKKEAEEKAIFEAAIKLREYDAKKIIDDKADDLSFGNYKGISEFKSFKDMFAK